MAFTPLKDPTGYLTREQVEQIIDCTLTPRDRLLIRLLWRTGARISEVLSIERSHIQWARGTILMRKLKKSGEPQWRVVPLDEETLALIRNQLASHKAQHLFPGSGHLGHLTSRQARYIFREAAERAGISEVGDPAISKYRHPHPHQVRHGFIIHGISQLGGDFESLRRIQELVGHSSIQTTSAYRTVSTSELRTAYNKIWGEERVALPSGQ